MRPSHLLLSALAGLAASPAGAMTFEAATRVGGGGYVAGVDSYDPGVALEFSVGLRPASWLTVQVHVDMMSLSPIPDPPFTLEDGSGLLLVYGLEPGFPVWRHADFEVGLAAQVGAFNQSVSGDDGFSEVKRSISGVAFGAAVDGWYQLIDNFAIGARLTYRQIVPFSRCDEIDSFEDDCVDVPDDAGSAAALTGTAGIRVSL